MSLGRREWLQLGVVGGLSAAGGYLFGRRKADVAMPTGEQRDLMMIYIKEIIKRHTCSVKNRVVSPVPIDRYCEQRENPGNVSTVVVLPLAMVDVVQ